MSTRSSSSSSLLRSSSTMSSNSGTNGGGVGNFIQINNNDDHDYSHTVLTNPPASPFSVDSHHNLQHQQSQQQQQDDRTPLTQRIKIDVSRDRYPYSIIWGSLPLITWIFPFIGHMGIADSEGRVHDFAGPYTIGIDRFMVSIAKYVQLDPENLPLELPESAAQQSHGQALTLSQRRRIWDAGIIRADEEYRHEMHNICCNNCHHHSAAALRYMGLHDMTMLQIWWLVTKRGRYSSWGSLIATYAPFCILWTIILCLVFLL